MGETAMATRLVTVTIEERYEGLFYATSPDLKGLLVAKESFEEAYREVPDSIAALYAACGQPVIVEPVGGAEHHHAWVAMPVVAAEAALARMKSSADHKP